MTAVKTKKTACGFLPVLLAGVLWPLCPAGGQPAMRAAGEQHAVKILTAPSFNCCGIYFNPESEPDGKCVLEYREKENGGDKWRQAYPPVYSRADKMCRGSIVNLAEDTAYEVRITPPPGLSAPEEKTAFFTEFKTWSSSPPIKKTIRIANDLSCNGHLVITNEGGPDGWLKYTGDTDFVLKGDSGQKPAVLLQGAKYVILENLAINGGYRHAVSVENSENIRIINCDISGWGRVGEQDFHRDGKYYLPDGAYVDCDNGVNIWESLNVVIERCYIHDPRNRANSWTFSHPAGPHAVMVKSRGGTVLRFNDFIGSDARRWNDAVGGYRNCAATGGFYRDADVHGNLFAFANDDGLELDGGAMNIRCFQNKFEGSLCGISIGPCLLGPAYVFRNLIVNPGEEHHRGGEAFKNGGGDIYDAGQILFFNNTVYGKCAAYGAYAPFTNHPVMDVKGTMRNNLFECRGGKHVFDFGIEHLLKRKNDFDYDLYWLGCQKLDEALQLRRELADAKYEAHGIFAKPGFAGVGNGDFRLAPDSPGVDRGVTVPNFCESFGGQAPDIGAFEQGEEIPLPYRPIPVCLDKYQMNFIQDGQGNWPAQKITAKVKGRDYKTKFKIVKNESFDWFNVEPSSGLLNSGGNIQFTVKIITEKAVNFGVDRGLFLLRQEDGYSRPVSVYAISRGHVNLRPGTKGINVYLEAETAKGADWFAGKEQNDVSGQKSVYLNYLKGGKGKGLQFEVEAPKDGEYMFFARVKSEWPTPSHDSFYVSLDNSEPQIADVQSEEDWAWVKLTVRRPLAEPGMPCLLANGSFKLSRGKHNVTLYPRESLFVDVLLMTDNLDFMNDRRRYPPPIAILLGEADNAIDKSDL
ncbi:MAG: right-handed parallel beta-helix repeat-containing protein [Kiritimatiellae bacterium]|nr:right-handed parallel beta-helix repeat-containing protein [Kiritimatiellia bacterium]